MLFDFLKDILYKKSGNILNLESEQEFQPYMLQRWISFYSQNYVPLLNKTLNVLYKSFDTKYDWYKIFLTTIPRTIFKKIKYVKKQKQKKQPDLDNLYTYLSKQYQLSKREVEFYINDHNINIEDLQRSLKGD